MSASQTNLMRALKNEPVTRMLVWKISFAMSLDIDGSRYIAACNTSPLDYIPHENYLTMADVIRNF